MALARPEFPTALSTTFVDDLYSEIPKRERSECPYTHTVGPERRQGWREPGADGCIDRRRRVYLATETGFVLISNAGKKLALWGVPPASLRFYTVESGFLG